MRVLVSINVGKLMKGETKLFNYVLLYYVCLPIQREDEVLPVPDVVLPIRQVLQRDWAEAAWKTRKYVVRIKKCHVLCDQTNNNIMC